MQPIVPPQHIGDVSTSDFLEPRRILVELFEDV
jgi:hypothetical protein